MFKSVAVIVVMQDFNDLLITKWFLGRHASYFMSIWFRLCSERTSMGAMSLRPIRSYITWSSSNSVCVVSPSPLQGMDVDAFEKKFNTMVVDFIRSCSAEMSWSCTLDKGPWSATAGWVDRTLQSLLYQCSRDTVHCSDINTTGNISTQHYFT